MLWRQLQFFRVIHHDDARTRKFGARTVITTNYCMHTAEGILKVYKCAQDDKVLSKTIVVHVGR